MINVKQQTLNALDQAHDLILDIANPIRIEINISVNSAEVPIVRYSIVEAVTEKEND